MEESLQVYQHLSGPKDTNTLKCHVSLIVTSGIFAILDTNTERVL